MINKIARTVLPNALSSLLNALAILVIVRTLSPAEWGQAASLLGVGQMLGSILSFGTQSQRIRRYGGLQDSELRAAAAVDTAARVSIASIVVITALVISFLTPELSSILIVVAGTFCSLGMANHLISAGRYLAAGALLLSEKVLVLLAVVVALSIGQIDSFTLSIAVGASALTMSVLVLASLRPRPQSFGVVFRAAATYWSGSFAVGVASVAPSLLLMDVVLVGLFAGADESGYFAVASRITAPFSILATAIAVVVLSEASRGTLDRGALSNRWTIVCLVAAIFLIGLAIVTAESWVPTLFGSEYERSVWPVRAYLVNVVFLLCTRTCVSLLHARSDDRFVAFAVAGQVALALVGIALGSSIGGEVLASVALAASNAVLALLLIRRVRAHRKPPSDHRNSA